MRRVFLDENVEPEFKEILLEFDCESVASLGLMGFRNGELLRRAAALSFHVFLRKDRSISHQNPIAKIGISVVVLKGPGKLADKFREKPEELITTLNHIPIGETREVTVPAGDSK